jgi:hypothetical protein
MCHAPTQNQSVVEINKGSVVIRKGMTLGTVIAVVASFSVNHSVLWAVLHGILSWVYVIYYAIAY